MSLFLVAGQDSWGNRTPLLHAPPPQLAGPGFMGGWAVSTQQEGSILPPPPSPVPVMVKSCTQLRAAAPSCSCQGAGLGCGMDPPCHGDSAWPPPGPEPANWGEPTWQGDCSPPLPPPPKSCSQKPRMEPGLRRMGGMEPPPMWSHPSLLTWALARAR